MDIWKETSCLRHEWYFLNILRPVLPKTRTLPLSRFWPEGKAETKNISHVFEGKNYASPPCVSSVRERTRKFLFLPAKCFDNELFHYIIICSFFSLFVQFYSMIYFCGTEKRSILSRHFAIISALTSERGRWKEKIPSKKLIFDWTIICILQKT